MHQRQRYPKDWYSSKTRQRFCIILHTHNQPRLETIQVNQSLPQGLKKTGRHAKYRKNRKKTQFVLLGLAAVSFSMLLLACIKVLKCCYLPRFPTLAGSLPFERSGQKKTILLRVLLTCKHCKKAEPAAALMFFGWASTTMLVAMFVHRAAQDADIFWSWHKNKDIKTAAGTAFLVQSLLESSSPWKRTFVVLSHRIFSVLIYRRERLPLTKVSSHWKAEKTRQTEESHRWEKKEHVEKNLTPSKLVRKRPKIHMLGGM